MKVGKDILSTGRKLSYQGVKYDKDGWANAKDYLPDDYDLMYLQIKDKEPCHGWISGKRWTGLKVKPGDEILYWKRKELQM